FFFQAEDGIRDFHVTGVQTCALPISLTCSLQLDGKSILPDFGGPWTGDKPPGRSDPVLPFNVNYMLYHPSGDQCLAVRVEPYRFSATVICILVTCLHFEWRSGSWAMETF